MKSKEKFLEIVTAGDVDEVWVNFQNPFTEDHEKDGEEFYVYKSIKEVGEKALADCALRLESFFAPKLNSNNEEEVLTVNLSSVIVTNKEDWGRTKFENNKSKLTLIYRKGEGILG